MSRRRCASLAILFAAQNLACGSVDTDMESWKEESSEGPTILDESQLDEASDDEGIGQIQQAIHNDWFVGPFSQGSNGSRLLASASTHVCVLTRIAGDFDHGGDEVRLLINSNNTWVLSASDGVSGAATCFKQRASPVLCSPSNPGCVGTDGFNANSSTRMIGEFSTVAVATSSSCTQKQVATFLGDATTFIGGLRGAMIGGGEFAIVDQSLSVNVQSQLRVQSCVSGTFSSPAPGLVAFGASFFAGNPREKPAKFLGSVFSVSTSGTSSVLMTNVHDAMCHFTKVQGGLQGGAEFAEIAPVFDQLTQTNRWRLRVGKGSASDLVAASARCYARDQR